MSYRVVRRLSPGPPGISNNPLFFPAKRLSNSQRQPLFVVQQIDNGDVRSSEFDHSFDVLATQVMGDPNGESESKALISQLEEDEQEHSLGLLSLSAIVSRQTLYAAVRLAVRGANEGHFGAEAGRSEEDTG